MTTSAKLRLGVTFHSFTNEYCSFQWSFEDMMQLASVLGEGVEIVGPAHHRCFPDVSDEFERVFKSSVERWGLTPTSYGTYADPFMLPGRDLNAEELTQYTLRQLRGAVKLGFPLARLQYFASSIVERVLPYADRHGLRLAYEFSAPRNHSGRWNFCSLGASVCQGECPEGGRALRGRKSGTRALECEKAVG